MMSENKELAYDGLPLPRRIFSVATVSLGVTVAVMDVTIMNVALPSMSQSMHLTEADTIWIVNGYQLAIIMCLLAMSTIGEIFSYRKVYMFGLSVFTIASLACAMSNGIGTLVASRMLQGLGASAMMAINMTLLRLSYPKSWLGKGIGLNATLVAIASVIGPSLSALILSYLSWRWLFLINLPLGALALYMGYKALPENVVRLSERELPKTDIVLNALFFGSLILVVLGYSHDFNPWVIFAIALVCFGVGFSYLRRQMSQEFPLFPIDLMRIPLFSLSVLTSVASFTAQMLAMVSIPFLLENTYGYTESETGVLFSAWPVSIMVAAPLAGSLIGKVNAGLLGGVGLAFLTLGIGSLAFLPDSPSYVDWVWRLMFCGFGFGLFQSPNNNVLLTSAPLNRSGSASGMLAMARLIGQTTGATLVALLFHIFESGAPRAALCAGSAVAFLACVVSVSRLALKKK
ncbi:MAG: MFS transporter [Paludibacteraceae bacterium]|nr:MFS transporter [Paludibacteraceae bacterium]